MTSPKSSNSEVPGGFEETFRKAFEEEERRGEKQERDSPTWDEVDAIRKGKSDIDLAEEIWRLREVANRETLNANYWKDKASAASATGRSAEIIAAVNALLDAEEMRQHNEAIFKGKWKKGSKAWSGAFIECTVDEAMAKLRAILRARKLEGADG
jgi:hypothetical protein